MGKFLINKGGTHKHLRKKRYKWFGGLNRFAAKSIKSVDRNCSDRCQCKNHDWKLLINDFVLRWYWSVLGKAFAQIHGLLFEERKRRGEISTKKYRELGLPTNDLKPKSLRIFWALAKPQNGSSVPWKQNSHRGDLFASTILSHHFDPSVHRCQSPTNLCMPPRTANSQ